MSDPITAAGSVDLWDVIPEGLACDGDFAVTIFDKPGFESYVEKNAWRQRPQPSDLDR
jgi:hypothetical protein